MSRYCDLQVHYSSESNANIPESCDLKPRNLSNSSKESDFSVHKVREIDAKRCWYAVDIEGNLPVTRAVMVPFIRKYGDMWDWKGIVAEIPSEGVVRSIVYYIKNHCILLNL
jgi:hypothetical protein